MYIFGIIIISCHMLNTVVSYKAFLHNPIHSCHKIYVQQIYSASYDN